MWWWDKENRSLCVCACLSVRECVEISQSSNRVFLFFFPTLAHTRTVINRHLVEHNPLAGFLKCDYQLGGDIKLLHLSVCFYLSIFPSPSNSLTLALSHTQPHTRFLTNIALQLLQLSMGSTGDKRTNCHVDIRRLFFAIPRLPVHSNYPSSRMQVSLGTIQHKSHSMAAPL